MIIDNYTNNDNFSLKKCLINFFGVTFLKIMFECI